MPYTDVERNILHAAATVRGVFRDHCEQEKAGLDPEVWRWNTPVGLGRLATVGGEIFGIFAKGAVRGPKTPTADLSELDIAFVADPPGRQILVRLRLSLSDRDGVLVDLAPPGDPAPAPTYKQLLTWMTPLGSWAVHNIAQIPLSQSIKVAPTPADIQPIFDFFDHPDNVLGHLKYRPPSRH